MFATQEFGAFSKIQQRKMAIGAIVDRVAEFREYYGDADADKVAAAVKFSFQRELAKDDPDWLELILKLIETLLPIIIQLFS